MDSFIHIIIQFDAKTLLLFEKWLESGYWGKSANALNLVAYIKSKTGVEQETELSRAYIEKHLFGKYQYTSTTYQKAKEHIEGILTPFLAFLQTQKESHKLKNIFQYWNFIYDEMQSKDARVFEQMIEKSLGKFEADLNKNTAESEEQLQLKYEFQQWRYAFQLHYKADVQTEIEPFFWAAQLYAFCFTIKSLLGYIMRIKQLKPNEDLPNEVVRLAQQIHSMTHLFPNNRKSALVTAYSNLLLFYIPSRPFSISDFVSNLQQNQGKFDDVDTLFLVVSSLNISLDLYKKAPAHTQSPYQLLVYALQQKLYKNIGNKELFQMIEMLDEEFYTQKIKLQKPNFKELIKYLKSETSSSQNKLITCLIETYEKIWEEKLSEKNYQKLENVDCIDNDFLTNQRRQALLCRIDYLNINKGEIIKLDNFRNKIKKQKQQASASPIVADFYYYLLKIAEIKVSPSMIQASHLLDIIKNSPYCLYYSWLVFELEKLQLIKGEWI